MRNPLVNRYFFLCRFYLLVLLVGIGAGIGAIFFRDLIGFFHNLFFYGEFSTYYDALTHALPSRWGMGIILVPVIGGIAVAYLIQNIAPEAKGSGVPEVMYAIYYKKGFIRPIVAIMKALSAALSIGSGASAGREGPIIQIGAAFGATVGQSLNMAKRERLILIACGAGGGIAASFNTPFTGILFAIEIMLSEMSAYTLIPVTIATAIATYLSRLYFGDITIMPYTALALHFNLFDILSYILLSIILGFSSVIFIRSIYYAEDLFGLLHHSYYIRHILGMFIVGVSMYVMMQLFGHYYIQGLGYATVADVLNLTLTMPIFLLFLALLKTATTAISIGSGASGGIFSPLVFIGATLGGSFAGFCNYFFPGHIDMSLQLGALAGVAGMIGASTGAPVMAIIMTAELTNDFTLILPLMVIVSIASGVRLAILRDSVFTFNLTRRGYVIPDSLHSRLVGVNH
jgi:chloride channel protein, CIC family